MRRRTYHGLGAALFLGLAGPALAQVSGWTPGPAMSVARYAATAAVLPDGRVLVAGGHNGVSTLSSAQVYHGATNSWTSTASSMSVSRNFLTSTVLRDGKVLVAGGYNSTGSLNQADLFDPVSARFTPLARTMNARRELFSATLLPSGKVLLAGGFTTFNWPGGGTQASAELFDPADGTFTQVGGMREARFGHEAILLPDESGSTTNSRYVLVVGGKLRVGSGDEWARNTAELYDIEAGGFVATYSMRHRRDRPMLAWVADRDAQGAALPSGKVLVVGGKSQVPTAVEADPEYGQVYNPKECEWFDVANGFTPGPLLSHGRMAHTLTPLADGGFLVANGWDQQNGVCTPTTERFLPVERQFVLAGNTSSGSVDAVAARLPDGRILVAGGLTGSTYLKRVDLYSGPGTVVPTPGNEAPVTAGDAYSTAEDTRLTVAAPGVLGNDSDPNGDALTASLASAPARGSVSLGTDGSFTYTPQANYHGPDSFTYVVSDGKGGSTAGTVTLTVTPVNDAPRAAADSATTRSGVPVVIRVLTNDSDPDGDVLGVSAVTKPASGTATINADGTITYTPAGTYRGTLSFSYTISDGQGATATASVTVTVGKSSSK